MRISLSTFFDKLIWLLTVMLFVAFFVFDMYSWGRYAFLGITLLIALFAAFRNGGRLQLRLQAYHGFFAVFILYLMINSLWAWNPDGTREKAITLFLIFACSAILYLHYQSKDDIHSLLQAVMWSGYIVAIYAVAVYGVDKLSNTEDRLDTEFANINTIGMIGALACVLQVNEFLNKRNRWSAIMMLPTICVLAATQSRKALVFLTAGVFLLYILRTLQQKEGALKILKAFGYTVLVGLVLLLLLRLPIFSGVLERMRAMIANWTGEGEVDNSTLIRSKMIDLGMKWFSKYPVGGIGIGNTGILTSRYLGRDTYLHNNFVELLCGGGVVGFALYYIMYAYLLVNLIKYRHADRSCFVVGLVWLILMLIMNYGMVTYYTKIQWYYLMIHFLNVQNLKKKSLEMCNESQKTAESGN